MKFKLLTIIFLTSFFTSFAQTTIEGVVNDSKGLPLIGANVTVKGTKNEVFTDFDGVFKIKAKLGDVLIVSILEIKIHLDLLSILLNVIPR